VQKKKSLLLEKLLEGRYTEDMALIDVARRQGLAPNSNINDRSRQLVLTAR
jgi:hypothetical protein